MHGNNVQKGDENGQLNCRIYSSPAAAGLLYMVGAAIAVAISRSSWIAKQFPYIWCKNEVNRLIGYKMGLIYILALRQFCRRNKFPVRVVLVVRGKCSCFREILFVFRCFQVFFMCMLMFFIWLYDISWWFVWYLFDFFLEILWIFLLHFIEIIIFLPVLCKFLRDFMSIYIIFSNFRGLFNFFYVHVWRFLMLSMIFIWF